MKSGIFMQLCFHYTESLLQCILDERFLFEGGKTKFSFLADMTLCSVRKKRSLVNSLRTEGKPKFEPASAGDIA